MTMAMSIIHHCGGHKSHVYSILCPERIKKDLTAFLSRVLMLRSIARTVRACYNKVWGLMLLHIKSFTVHWHFQIPQWVIQTLSTSAEVA